MASEREARIEAALLEMARGIDEDDGLPCWCPSPTLAAFNRKHPDWDGGKYPETAGHLPFCGRMRAALAALQDGASGHVCARPSTCKCSPVGDEPNELCPVHGGGEWPPRCAECGRLMPWPASSQDGGDGRLLREGRIQGMRKAVQILRAQGMTSEAAGTLEALIAIVVAHIEHFFPEEGTSQLSRDIKAITTSTTESTKP